MSEKVVYTGHFVKDQANLLAKLPPAITSEGSTVFAHHVTKEFEPENGTAGLEIGRERTLHITGQVIADGVHTALVESPDGEDLTVNDQAHITIATAAGVEPVESNTVIAKAKQNGTIIPLYPPIEVVTIEGYFDGEEVHTRP